MTRKPSVCACMHVIYVYMYARACIPQHTWFKQSFLSVCLGQKGTSSLGLVYPVDKAHFLLYIPVSSLKPLIATHINKLQCSLKLVYTGLAAITMKSTKVQTLGAGSTYAALVRCPLVIERGMRAPGRAVAIWQAKCVKIIIATPQQE